MLVIDDSFFVTHGRRRTLLANGGIPSYDCECLSELETSAANHECAATEHASEYELLPKRRGGVASIASDFTVAHKEIGSWDADVVEDCITIVGAVVGHLQTVKYLAMRIKLVGGIHTQYLPAQYLT